MKKIGLIALCSIGPILAVLFLGSTIDGEIPYEVRVYKDKTGGLIYGLVKGLLMVTVIFAVITLASPLIDEKYINII